MSGFDNECLHATNVDFRGVQPVVPQITQNGQLLIGSNIAPYIRAGYITSVDSSVTITRSRGSIDLSVPPGGVTSVSGTANRITSTGGITPVIDIAATYVGQTSIVTLGTVTTGTWTATKVSEAYGGTNQSTYASGDILYASAINTLAKLPISTDGKVLTLSAGLPSWQPAAGGTSLDYSLSFLYGGF